jgi:putative DNA primase/helicase
MAVNHKPVIKGGDHAIWRRIRLLPFEVQIPEEQQDRELSRKLEAELSGILNWALKGCLDWQRDGLGNPPVVKAATANYRDEMDIIGDFIKDCCEVYPEATVPASELYAAYVDWAAANGEKKPLSQRTFGTILTERGFDKHNNGRKRLRTGIALVGGC